MENCFDQPSKGTVKEPQNSTVQSGGKLTSNEIAMIVGLSVGIPVWFCVVIIMFVSYKHYKKTTEIKRHTVRIKNEMNLRDHHRIGQDDYDMPAPPVPVKFNSGKHASMMSQQISRPISFRMPNGRVQSVRVGKSGNGNNDKPLPIHPRKSFQQPSVSHTKRMSRNKSNANNEEENHLTDKMPLIEMKTM